MTLNFGILSPWARQKLLDGPTILIVVTDNGTTAEHHHQLATAKHIVAHDRYRQLHEQAENIDRPFILEFPVQALMAASETFREIMIANPGETKINLHMNGVLPGFVMEILDWYVKALHTNVWVDFLPREPSIEDADKYFWSYSYIAMRTLGMGTFSDALCPFIEMLIDRHQLADEMWAAEILLKYIPENDPVILRLATRYAELIEQGKSPLSNVELDEINGRFPQFGARVNRLLVKTTSASANDEMDIELLSMRLSAVLKSKPI